MGILNSTDDMEVRMNGKVYGVNSTSGHKKRGDAEGLCSQLGRKLVPEAEADGQQ